jgi:gluconolactonase
MITLGKEVMVKMSGSHKKLADIVPEDSRLERLGTDFQFTEGPVWNAEDGLLLFSDIPANRIYAWSPDRGVTLFREPSGNSNGLTYDREGRLILCEHGTRRLSRLENREVYTILSERFQGKRLNSPNDAVVKSDGTIYFTDPPYGIQPEEQELPFQGVFRYDPERQDLTLLADDFNRPNGIAFSPDERVLYIADSSSRRRIRAYTVRPDGMLSGGHVFAAINSESPGNPDGMKIDVEGNLYSAAAGGIWVFSADGENLGIISTPETPANCAWGDEDGQGLYITARTSIYRIRLNVPGVPPIK